MNEPIASGREADIFALDAGRVLRRNRRATDVTAEAAVMTHVAAHGHPLPVAPGDPLRLLDDAFSIKSRQSTLTPEQIEVLGTAADRVRGGR